MKKRLAYILFLISAFLPLAGQGLIIINNDTTKTFNDSIALTSDKPYENIKWEYLLDDNWIPYSDGPEAFVRLDSSMIFRGVSFDSLCRLRITDWVEIDVIEPVEVSGYEFQCDQEGGFFRLFDSVNVKIPETALETLTNLELIISPTFNRHPFGNTSNNPDRQFLFGFEFIGDQIMNKEAKIRIETSAIPYSQILQIFIYEETSKNWNYFNTNLLFNASEGYVETSVGYGRYAVFAQPLVDDLRNQKKNFNDSTIQKNCKDGTIHVSEVSIDMLNGECQVIKNTNRVNYIDCGNTSGGIIEQSIDSVCEPEISYEIEHSAIKVGETTTLSFKIEIGNYPLEDQVVTLQAPESVSISPVSSDRTNAEGIISFTVKGNSEALPAIINYTAPVYYYLTSQLAYEGTQREYNTGKLVMKPPLTGSIWVHIISDCTEPETINCGILVDPDTSCEKLKKELPVLVMVDPSPIRLKKGTVKTATVFAFSQNSATKPPKFTLVPNDPRKVSGHIISEDEIAIIGIEEGQTTLNLLWCDETVKIDVEVLENTECDSAVVEVYPKSLKLIENASFRLKLSYGEDPDFIPVISFKSTSPQIASVDSFGLVNALKTGEAIITVSWCEFYSIDVPVEVVDECNATNVHISPEDLVIEKTEHYPLDIEYESLGKDSLFIPLITWKSDNEAIATVNEFGVVYGVNIGTTSILASWCDDDSIRINVEVKEASCITDPFQSKCYGWLISPLMYTDIKTGSEGGTFSFQYNLEYRVVYKITNGVAAQPYIYLTGKYFYNWSQIYLNTYCDLEGNECIMHINFMLVGADLSLDDGDGIGGTVKVTCTYREDLEQEETKNYSLKFTSYHYNWLQ